MILPRRATRHLFVAAVMSLTAPRVAGAVALSAALLAGCAGNKTGDGGGSTTATNGSDPSEPLANGARAIEADSLVKPKPNMFPPVDVGG